MRRALKGLLKEYDNAFKYTKRRGKSQGTRRVPVGDAFEPITTLVKFYEAPVRSYWDCGNDVPMKLFPTIEGQTNPNSGAYH